MEIQACFLIDPTLCAACKKDINYAACTVQTVVYANCCFICMDQMETTLAGEPHTFRLQELVKQYQTLKLENFKCIPKISFGEFNVTRLYQV